MKFVVHALLGLSLVSTAPAFAAPAALTGAASAAPAASNAAHMKAVQDLLASMHVEYVLRGVAGRTRYPSDAQRQAIFAKLDKVPAAEIAQRMAVPLAQAISADTATEMARFYNTPYGKKVIHDKYNSGPGLSMPGMRSAVPAEEKKERKRAAYVLASKELDAAQPAIEHEAFVLLQAISKEKR